MNDFYFEVLSNASYETNTVAEFKNRIQLLHPLEGDWEIGLAEISYTKSWYNVSLNSTLGLVTSGFQPSIDTNAYDFVSYNARSGTLKNGYYESVEVLIDEINKELEHFKTSEFKQIPILFYDKIATKKVYIIPGKDKDDQAILPYIDHDLRKLLGFTYYYLEDDVIHTSTNDQGIVISHQPPDLTMGIRQLLVYCNLIMPPYVGDSRSKLLRSVDIPHAKFGEQITISYEKPHYVPLLCNDFDEIEINFNDDE